MATKLQNTLTSLPLEENKSPLKKVDFPHECDDWDGLLIEPDWLEFKFCRCEYFEEQDG